MLPGLLLGAASGTYWKEPWLFQHHPLGSCVLLEDGVKRSRSLRSGLLFVGFDRASDQHRMHEEGPRKTTSGEDHPLRFTSFAIN
jgi:hypothetical protein